MRPRGDVRVALREAAVGVGRPGATWRGLARLAGVGLDAARVTAENMVRAGELIVIGHHKEPGVCRPMNLLTVPTEAPQQPGAALDQAIRSWADFS